MLNRSAAAGLTLGDLFDQGYSTKRLTDARSKADQEGEGVCFSYPRTQWKFSGLSGQLRQTAQFHLWTPCGAYWAPRLKISRDGGLSQGIYRTLCSRLNGPGPRARWNRIKDADDWRAMVVSDDACWVHACRAGWTRRDRAILWSGTAGLNRK
jgi:hypothetical protein